MSPSSPGGAAQGHDNDHEHADAAGAPLDLLLTDAARSPWQRILPRTSTLRFAAGLAQHPAAVAGRLRGLAGELGEVVLGTSQAAPDAKDRRFSDEAWTGNPVLRRALQSYLALSRTAEALVDDAELDETDDLRVRAAVGNASDALAPSNNPLVNPRALRAVVDSGGGNFVRGVRNLARDLASSPRVPTMVEPDAFEVGETVAATPAPSSPARRCSS